MARYVAFLRAINLPGRNVKMDAIRAAMAPLGFDNVETFIASGNVIFDAEEGDHTERIEAALEAAAGFPIPVYLRSAEEVIAVADRFPFSENDGDFEVSFLPAVPDPETAEELIATATSSDRLAVVGREVYWLHEGLTSESDHSEDTVMRILGMPTTRRSIRTVRRIADKYLR